MNKKAQFARAMARTSATVARENRKIYARAMANLGISPYEMTDVLGVSSSTVNTYLKESEGTGYSDIFEFAMKDEIFQLFNTKEQEFLERLSENMDKSKFLSKESLRTHRIFKGEGLSGLFHKYILKDSDSYKQKNEKISEQIHSLKKEMDKMSKDIFNSKKYPHLSKAKLSFRVYIHKKE